MPLLGLECKGRCLVQIPRHWRKQDCFSSFHTSEMTQVRLKKNLFHDLASLTVVQRVVSGSGIFTRDVYHISAS